MESLGELILNFLLFFFLIWGDNHFNGGIDWIGNFNQAKSHLVFTNQKPREAIKKNTSLKVGTYRSVVLDAGWAGGKGGRNHN